MVNKRSFDWDSARVSAIMAGLLIISLLAVPVWLLLQPEAKEAVVINALWSVFNLLLLSAALLVAFEQPQLRRAHRLNRQVTAIVHNFQTASWTGKTLDISENGARIQLDSWSNLPDIIELELVGDFGARAVLDARIIRVDPIDESQILIAVDFVDVTQAQYDALCLVIYSDVEEWYSQQSQNIDRPFASLGFLATGLLRAFREPRAAERMSVRKQIHAAAQLYWEGHFYEGTATEMSSRSLRLELDARTLPNLESMRQMQPPVGLLLSQDGDDPQPKRLVAHVQTVEAPVLNFTASVDRSRIVDSVAIELEFPQNLDYRQGGRIKQLLRSLR
ncbi:MAG: hypothetical protein F6K28_60085 [Microcoleus sp. SIO2G3]|nr:hypothetical protein [Microcoleus sp. SIO2G3]